MKIFYVVDMILKDGKIETLPRLYRRREEVSFTNTDEVSYLVRPVNWNEKARRHERANERTTGSVNK